MGPTSRCRSTLGRGSVVLGPARAACRAPRWELATSLQPVQPRPSRRGARHQGEVAGDGWWVVGRRRQQAISQELTSDLYDLLL
jgi:hypothetical protein